MSTRPLMQPHRSSSPWTLQYRLYLLIWMTTWSLFCSWTPKPFNRFRIYVLRLFGARIGTHVFVHQRARIAHPCNLELGDGCCLGDAAHLYNLAPIFVRSGATIAQEAYLCTASHDFSLQTLPLISAPIVIEEDAFIGARAFVLPGVTVGRASVVGACSVVTRSVPPHQTVAGNPARRTTKRS